MATDTAVSSVVSQSSILSSVALFHDVLNCDNTVTLSILVTNYNQKASINEERMFSLKVKIVIGSKMEDQVFITV